MRKMIRPSPALYKYLAKHKEAGFAGCFALIYGSAGTDTRVYKHKT